MSPARLLVLLLLLSGVLAGGPAGAQELLVASRGSDRIIRFDRDGNFAGVFAAGATVPSPSSIAFGRDGRVYAGVREASGARAVRVWSAEGVLQHRLVASALGDVTGLAEDLSGGVCASVGSAGEVVRWNPDRTFYGTFAYGSGLSQPAGLAVAGDGKLYVASKATGQVLIWNPDGTFSRVFRSFGASAEPLDVALAADGSVFVLLRLSSGQTGVGVYTAEGSFVRFHSGGAVMPSPTGIALRPGDDAVFVTDSTSGLLRLGSDGAFRVVVPNGTHGLSQASAVRFRPSGRAGETQLAVQGVLASPSGSPVPDGRYQLRFRFYNQPSGGSPLWTSPQFEAETSAGAFSVRIDQVPPALFQRDSVWLETVLGSAPLPPRQLLGSQGVALGSVSASAVRGAPGGAVVFRPGDRPALTVTSDNAFTVIATGGATFATVFDSGGQPAGGPVLHPGAGSWASLSDASLKVFVAPSDPATVLQRLGDLKLFRWRYLGQRSGVSHIGPLADEFRAAFGVGEDDRTISTVDPDGIALAALKGLLERVAQQEETIRRLEDLVRSYDCEAAR